MAQLVPLVLLWVFQINPWHIHNQSETLQEVQLELLIDNVNVNVNANPHQTLKMREAEHTESVQNITSRFRWSQLKRNRTEQVTARKVYPWFPANGFTFLFFRDQLGLLVPLDSPVALELRWVDFHHSYITQEMADGSLGSISSLGHLAINYSVTFQFTIDWHKLYWPQGGKSFEMSGSTETWT